MRGDTAPRPRWDWLGRWRQPARAGFQVGARKRRKLRGKHGWTADGHGPGPRMTDGVGLAHAVSFWGHAGVAPEPKDEAEGAEARDSVSARELSGVPTDRHRTVGPCRASSGGD